MRNHARVIAQGRVSRIELCGCDGIHLTIGAVTVRLPPGSFEDLSATIADATTTLSLLAERPLGAMGKQ
jgi:hypothetical protein